jgi:hypothetical protein
MVLLQYLFSTAKPKASAPIGMREKLAANWTLGHSIKKFSSVGHESKNRHQDVSQLHSAKNSFTATLMQSCSNIHSN